MPGVKKRANECTIEQLKDYLDENKLENSLNEFEFNGKIEKYIVFKFPVARTYEEILVSETASIDSIMQSNFVKYRGISNYEAIWSSELKCIECEIQEPKSTMPPSFLVRKLYRIFKPSEISGNGLGMKTPKEIVIFEDDKINVSIGISSKEFAFLSLYKDGRNVDLDVNTGRYRITLKINNVLLKTEDEARELLEKISNSLLYQIDVRYDLSITLSPRRISRRERRLGIPRRIQKENGQTTLSLDYEYDKIPMALYWFAQNSTSSPIFMYFALYQVLEYYFPIYSTIEIKSQVQNLIKDPRFNINSDEDMVRLLHIMSSNDSTVFGDEREQLDNVLRHIITSEDVINYIEERNYLKSYYTEKISNKLSDKKLRLTDNIAILSDLSSRIYDIRCRIVHNKASETSKKILPVTKEAEYLRYETELLKFVAQKAIIANSKPMLLNV